MTNNKREPMAPPVKRWKRTEMAITLSIIVASGMVVAGVALAAIHYL